MNGHRCCPHHRHYHGYYHHEHEDASKQPAQAASKLPVLPRTGDTGAAAAPGAVRTPAAAALEAALVQQEAGKVNGAKKPLSSARYAGIPLGSKPAPPSSHNDQRPQEDAGKVGKGCVPAAASGTRVPRAPSLKPALQRVKTSAVDSQKKPQLKEGIRAEPPASSRPPITAALAGGAAVVEPASKRNADQPKGATKLAVAPSAQPDPAKSTAANLPIAAHVASSKSGAALATQKKTPDTRGPKVQAPQRAPQAKNSRAEPPVVRSMKDDAGGAARMLPSQSARVINEPLRATNKPELPLNLLEKQALAAVLKEAGSAPKPLEPGAPLIDKTKEEVLKKRSTVVPQGPKSRSAAEKAKPTPLGAGPGIQTRADVPALRSQGPPRYSAAEGALAKAGPAVQEGKLPSAAPLRHDLRVAAPQSAGRSNAGAAVPRSREAPRLKRLNDGFEIRKELPKIRGAEEVATAEPPKAAGKKASAVAASGRPITKAVKDDRPKTAKAADTAKVPVLGKKSKTEQFVRKDHDDQGSNGDASPTRHVEKLYGATKVQAQAKGKPVAIKTHVQDGKGHKANKQKRYSESAGKSREALEMATNKEAPGVTKGKSGAWKAHVAPSDKKPQAVPTKSSRAPPFLHGARKGAGKKVSIRSEKEAETEDLSVVDESPEEEAPQRAKKGHKEKLTSALPPQTETRQKHAAAKKATEAVIKRPSAAAAVNEAARQLEPHVKRKSATSRKEKPAYSRDDSSSYKQRARTKKPPKQTRPARDVAPALTMLGRFGQLFRIAHKPSHGGEQEEKPATPSEIHTANDFSTRSTITQGENTFSTTSAPASTRKRAKKTLASETGTGAPGTSVGGTTAVPTSRAESAFDTTATTTAAATTGTTAAGTTQGGSGDGSSGSSSPSDPLKMWGTVNLPPPPPEDSSSKKRMLAALMAVAVLVTALTVACSAIAMMARQALKDWAEAVSAIDTYENVTPAAAHRYQWPLKRGTERGPTGWRT